jgi:predicted alpha/beta superfamily hydrolase
MSNLMKESSLHFKRVAHWPSLIYRSQTFQIPGLDGERPVSLYLPPDYFTSDKTYPLAFFFDGQNLYEDEGTMAGGWHLHRILDQRSRAGKEVPVVVGVYHGPDRDAEMSPWDPYPGKRGKAERKLNWMLEWLLPRLHRKLHLRRANEQTLVGGSSLGGLLALYSLFHYPEQLGRGLIMSPALWVNQFAIYNALMLTKPHAEAKVYIDHGEKEGCECHGNVSFQQTKLMADLLEVLEFKPQQNLLWNPDPEGLHNEQSWHRRLPVALDFLYEGQLPQ